MRRSRARSVCALRDCTGCMAIGRPLSHARTHSPTPSLTQSGQRPLNIAKSKGYAELAKLIEVRCSVDSRCTMPLATVTP